MLQQNVITVIIWILLFDPKIMVNNYLEWKFILVIKIKVKLEIATPLNYMQFYS